MVSTVLVADDSATIQKVIKIALSRFDVRVVAASSLQEALGVSQETRADFAVIDGGLAGARQPSDLHELKQKLGSIPVILLVGSYDNVDEEAFRGLGFHHFLHKPFDNGEFVRRLTDDLGVPLGQKAAAPPPPPPPIPGQAPTPAPQASAAVPPPLSTAVPPPPPPGSGFAPPAPPIPTVGGGGAVGGGAMVEPEAKGRPAFGSGSGGGPPSPPPSPPGNPAYSGSSAPPPPPPAQGTGGQGEDLAGMVRAAVEDYCRTHFPEIAREIIQKELRRLAEEKTRRLTRT